MNFYTWSINSPTIESYSSTSEASSKMSSHKSKLNSLWSVLPEIIKKSFELCVPLLKSRAISLLESIEECQRQRIEEAKMESFKEITGLFETCKV